MFEFIIKIVYGIVFSEAAKNNIKTNINMCIIANWCSGRNYNLYAKLFRGCVFFFFVKSSKKSETTMKWLWKMKLEYFWISRYWLLYHNSLIKFVSLGPWAANNKGNSSCKANKVLLNKIVFEIKKVSLYF